VIEEKNAIKYVRNSVDMGSYREAISDEIGELICILCLI
jgi:hypothetical protein